MKHQSTCSTATPWPRSTRLACLLATAIAMHTSAGAQTIAAADSPPETPDVPVEISRLLPGSLTADGAYGEKYGHAIAISGDTAIVGAPNDDGGGLEGNGAVYVLRRVNGAWTLKGKLLAVDIQANAAFGSAVALQGDTLVVGAPGARCSNQWSQECGALYVFKRTNGTWTQRTRIQREPWDASRLGAVLAMDDGVLVTGTEDGTKAYVYADQGTQWTEQANFWLGGLNTHTERPPQYLAIDGDTIAIADPRTWNTNGAWPGQVTVHRWSQGAWREEASLATPLTDSRAFGTSVALSNGRLLVSDPEYGGSQSSEGRVHAFVRQGSTWNLQSLITSPTPSSRGRFGINLSVSGDTALIGGNEGRWPDPVFFAYTYAANGWSAPSAIDPPTSVSQYGVAAALNGRDMLFGAGGFGDLGSVLTYQFDGTKWQQQGANDAGIGVSHSYLGSSVALSGKTALAAAAGQSVVLVLSRTDGKWAETARLAESAFNGVESVALDGAFAAVGETITPSNSATSTGAAHLYRRDGTSWIKEGVLAPPGANIKRFGHTVALSNEKVVVGTAESFFIAKMKPSIAAVYARKNGKWSLPTTLRPTNPGGEGFGFAVDIDADTIAVGAPGDSLGGSTRVGSVYVFVQQNGKWITQARLVAAVPLPESGFGSSVAVDGERVYVGAPDGGSVYVFQRSGNTWAQTALIRSNDGAVSSFGSSLATANGSLLVGAPWMSTDDATTGVTYLFQESQSGWQQIRRVHGWATGNYPRFGSSVALSGTSALIGAPYAASTMVPYGSIEHGSVYALPVPPAGQ